ncbi:MAG: 60S ribosomal protein L31 [Candidatus Diapherotrites archaeon]|nr:60S ribosomal protein L31 [Candidatus Diapherotrites archaeon]
MKGNEAEYVISLRNAFTKPPLKRPKAALNEIKRFVSKHTRIKEISIAMEVNEFIFKNSKNIPRKVNAVLLKQKDKVTVYLKGSKKLEEDKKKAVEKTKDKKKKEEKKETKEAKKQETEEEEKKEKELKEKKEREKAAEAVSIKRK